jgi:hypothetical protein
VDRRGWFYADAPGMTQISAESLSKIEAQAKATGTRAASSWQATGMATPNGPSTSSG